MVRKRVPCKLWYYVYQYIFKTIQHTASFSGIFNGRTSIEKVTGEIPDISEFLDFVFYDRFWYRENAGLSETLYG